MFLLGREWDQSLLLIDNKLIGRATRASQLALGPSALACITKIKYVQQIIHKDMNIQKYSLLLFQE